MTAKNWFLVLVACILAVSLTSCQSAPAPTKAVVLPTTEATATNSSAYPNPTVSTAANVSTTATAYPEPQISSEPGNWSDVLGLLQKGDVTKIIQTYNMNVYLTLKDGRTIKVAEPAFDDIAKLLVQCGDPCKGLSIANP